MRKSMSGEETWISQQRVLEALTPSLSAEYDPSQPGLVGFVLCSEEMTEQAIAETIRRVAAGARRGPPLHWGWLPRGDMAEVLRKSDMAPMAADLEARRGEIAGHVQCVVMLGGLATVANLPLEGLRQATSAPAAAPVKLDQSARNKAKAARRARR
jgi:hypothetical protein